MKIQNCVPFSVHRRAFAQVWYLQRRQPALFILLCVFLTLVFYHLLLSTRTVAVVAQPTLAVVSAASGEANALAPNSLATAYGAGLASDSFSAPVTGALPTELGGTRLAVTDSNGVERFAPLLLVSPTQINFLLPAGMAGGTARVTVRNGGNSVGTQTINVQAVAPAFFTLDGSGRGVPSGFLLRVKSTGQQLYEPLAQYDETAQRYQPRALDLGPEGEQVFLVLFLTGLGNAADPNSDGNLNDTVKLLIGGTEVPVVFAGKQNEYGLDQLNALIPRRLSGRGSVKLAVAVTGAPASNLTDIEIAAPAGNNPPTITSFSANAVLAGQSLEISGSGFSANASDNFVRFVGNNPPTVEAEASAVTANKMTVNVPFGAGTGSVYVGNAQGLRQSAMPSVRTSVSGFVQNTQRVAIPGMLVRVRDTNITTTTNSDGTFVLADVPPGQRVEVEIDSPTSNLPYPLQKLSLRVIANRDNQINRTELGLTNDIVINVPNIAGQTFSVAVERAADPTLAQLAPEQASITIDIAGRTVRCPDGNTNCPLTLTAFAAGRTPVDLPAGHFSSAIAQLTPFGATIAPGAKLTFPNSDRIPTGAAVRLFKLDQTPGSETLGTFVDIGAATVTADGQRIETAPNAITEASYYFVSTLRPTAALSGHISEADGRPVRRAIVAARGQSTFTDGNGGFVLRNLPVLAANDQVVIEASFQRPDGTISRAQSNPIGITANSLTFIPTDLTLPPRAGTTGPKLLTPAALTISEGETREFNFLATGLAAGTQPALVNPPSFASLRGLGNEAFALRLAPPTGSAGNYQLTVTASGAANASTQQVIAVTVTPASTSVPTAIAQAVTTDEDTPRQITLTSANAGGASVYSIVMPPLHGTLIGALPNVTYSPSVNYNGTDSFSFKVGSGNDGRSIAVVSIAVRPVNDPPVITSTFSTPMVNAGQVVKLIVTATDPDDDQLTCLTSDAPAGATLNPQPNSRTSWQFSWTPIFTQVGTYTVGFTVTDAGSPALRDTKTATINVDAKWAETSGPGGGPVRSLFSSGTNVFAGTATGKIYYSSDSGRSWTDRSRGLPPERIIQAIVGDETRLLAGTNGTGIYRSLDGGQTWNAVNTGLTNRFVAAFAVSGTIIFAGTSGNGVFRSNDGGQSWVASNAGMEAAGIFTLLFSGPKLFAGVSGNPGIYVSTDQGRTWSPITGRVTPNPIYNLATNGSTLLAAGPGAFIDRSTDNGQTWTRLNLGISGQPATTGLLVTGQTILISFFTAGIYRSTDNGQNWLPVTNGLRNPFVNELVASGNTILAATSSTIFSSSDKGASWAESSAGVTNAIVRALGAVGTEIFASTTSPFFGSAFGTVYRSVDRGQSWATLTTGLPTQIDARAFATINSDLFIAGYGHGVYRSTDNGQSWSQANTGLANLSVTALTVYSSNLFTATQGGGISRTNDNGARWNPANNGLGNLNVNALAASNSALVAATNNGLFRLTDISGRWLSVGLPNLRINTLAASGTTFFAGIDGGGVYRSINDGQTWLPVSNNLPNLRISSLAAGGNNVFAGTVDSGVFLSMDNGQSWGTMNTDLTNRFVNALAMVGGNLFAGTTSSVLQMSSSVQSWAVLNSGLLNTSVNVVAADGKLLYAGTLGSGVFRSADQGANWTAASHGLPPSTNVQTIATSGASLFVGTFGNGIYRSVDNGNNWAELNNGLPRSTTNPQQSPRNINALRAQGELLFAATDGGLFRFDNTAGNGNWVLTNLVKSTLSVLVSDTTLYAGTLDDGVYRSIDGGQTWHSLSNRGLGDLMVSALSISINGTSLFAGTSAGIYRSNDQGQSWTAVNRDLPTNLVVTSFAVSGTKLYVGSVYGIFLSEDNGESWKQLNAGLLDIYLTSLALIGDKLFGATKIGGIFLSQIPNQPPCLGISAQPASQTIASGGRATLNVTPSGDQPFQFQWYRGASGDLSQPITGATASSYITPNLTATTNYWVRVTNGCSSVNSETASVIVNGAPQADLALTQTVTPGQALPGATLNYTLTLSNNGPSAAFAVNVTDALPAAVSFNSCAATGGGVCGGAGNNRTITFAGLSASASATITLTARVNPNAAGTFTNIASVTASSTDANPANNTAVQSVTAQNPVPTLASLNPSVALAGSAGFTLTVNGSGFVNGAVVRWQGNDRATTFASSTQLTATILVSDIVSAGSAQVAVFNPAPGGGVSNALSFTISQPPHPVPTLTTLNPNTAFAGGAAFTLTVNGTNFVNGATVQWNGNPRATSFVSSAQLMAAIPASDITNVGTANVTVSNPASSSGGGGVSNALSFTISQPPNPVPTLAALNPNVATAGGTAFTLTVSGASFVNGATVQWNSSARPTTFVNSAQLTAAIPASDLANAGTASVTVFNPANASGGGGVSNPLVFTINQLPNPTPTLTSLNPNAATVGGTAFTLTVNGAGFINASAIRWNGQERLTNFINSSQLTAQIPASELVNTGTAQVTVFNSASSGGGGGTSNALTFTISPAVNALANVSAASYRNTAFAGDSIAAAFGTNLATRIEVANSLPLPTSLAGTSVRVKDSAGTERLAQLFFVAPSQINYLIPAGLANGTATVTVTAGDGALSAGQVQLATVAPGLFTANANGQGVPAALVLRVAANGAQTIEPVARFDATLNAFVPVPLDLGPPTDQLFLILYGTGMRGLGSLSAATAMLGGVNLPVLFVGAVDGLVGLDQGNLGPLPRTLAGRGNLDLVLLLNGQTANTVQLNVK